MRIVLAAVGLLCSTSAARAAAAPNIFADFIAPLTLQDNNTLAAADGLDFNLLRRQGPAPNECAKGYAACDNLNAPGLCCRTNQVCSADAANHVACCPLNAACTGTIDPVNPSIVTPAPTAARTTAPIAPPAGSFVQSGVGPSSRSWVPNDYYPFPAIPTTYTNAAACSRAYSTCQSDAHSCTSALASGLPGVTISGPNGGATITAIASLGQVSASAICSSLSSKACSGLIVEACASFGGENAARTRCAPMYGVGAGVALGLAGQLLR